jgi:raffinose/stachyose/melibiose transport system permease protein
MARFDYNFVGFANFVRIFTADKYFTRSIIFTIELALVLVILRNVIGLGLALAVNATARKLQGFFRTAYFLPYMFSIIVTSFMFRFIFAYVIPAISQTTDILAFLDQAWIGDPQISFWSITIIHLWRAVPFMMIIYLAGIVGIPLELKEAASVDGASGFQKLVKIILPMIMPAITICVFISLQESFRIFDIVYGFTGGGPARQTETMALNIYLEGFSSHFLFGVASAKAVILFLIIIILAFLQISFTKKREIEA